MSQRFSGVTQFFERQLEAMSPRDRRLLMGMVGFFTFAGLFLLVWTLHGLREDKASRVRNALEGLESAKALQIEYQQAAAQLAAQESRLRQYQGKRVSAMIEEIATKRGVLDALRAVNESGAEVVGNIKQTKYSVELKSLDHDVAMGFLYELETSGYPVSVELAEFKNVKVKGESKLNLNLELVAFSLAEG